MLKIVNRNESEYFKKYNPYFDSRAKYGRDADTIILYQFVTPTGRWSKYQATLRFNSERIHKNKIEKIEEYYNDLENKTFKNEIKKGYSIGEVILYSGNLE